jgi:serine/threonine protein kinase
VLCLFNGLWNMPEIKWKPECNRTEAEQRTLEWRVAKSLLIGGPDGAKIKKSNGGELKGYIAPGDPEGADVHLKHSFIKVGGQIYAMANSKYNPPVKGQFGKCKIGEAEDGKVVALKISYAKEGVASEEIETARAVGVLFGANEMLKSGKIVMAMTYLGSDLFDYLRLHRKALSQSQRYIIALSAVLAVIKFHKAGYIHRDIKAENMTIQDDNIQLVDYGLAKKIPSMDSAFYSERIVGTISEGFDNIAPEVKENGVYSVHSDIYALGQTLKLDILDSSSPLLAIVNLMISADSALRPDLDLVMVAFLAEIYKNSDSELAGALRKYECDIKDIGVAKHVLKTLTELSQPQSRLTKNVTCTGIGIVTGSLIGAADAGCEGAVVGAMIGGTIGYALSFFTPSKEDASSSKTMSSEPVVH